MRAPSPVLRSAGPVLPTCTTTPTPTRPCPRVAQPDFPVAQPEHPPSSQDTCIVCDEPSIRWPCCGAPLFCLDHTRVARNTAEVSYHFPHPRCPNCRVDYPLDSQLLYCVVCEQSTEVISSFTFTSTLHQEHVQVVRTQRPPQVTSYDTSWQPVTCCSRRVHIACLPRLQHGRCPLCISPSCLLCHLQCPSNCNPRTLGYYPDASNALVSCNPTPLVSWPCGHAACHLFVLLANLGTLCLLG